jgi:antitoxin FitA
MVQIRNVPDALHRKLKARALECGQTLSDYLLAELERLAARPTREEMLARLHCRKRVTPKTPAAVVIRGERESACLSSMRRLCWSFFYKPRLAHELRRASSVRRTNCTRHTSSTLR